MTDCIPCQHVVIVDAEQLHAWLSSVVGPCRPGRVITATHDPGPQRGTGRSYVLVRPSAIASIEQLLDGAPGEASDARIVFRYADVLAVAYRQGRIPEAEAYLVEWPT